MKFSFVKIVVYVPESHADIIRKTLGENGCGHIGNYDFCTFSVKGVGRYRPNAGANPFIGKQGVLEKVAEERIETICPAEHVGEVLAAVKKAHPYEEPAIDIYPLRNR